MNSWRNFGPLAHSELTALDSSIALIDAPGNIGDAGRSERSEQAAEAQERHARLVTSLSERDREIIGRIRALVAQLSTRTSLQQLERARAEVIQRRVAAGG